MWWKTLVFVAITAVIVFSFLTPVPQPQIGEASRIFYYHVPQAWVSVVAFTMSMVFSIRYLRSKSMIEDDKAVTAASLGFVFCALATITGSIFARVTWGSFWNWDPRETSVFVLLLIYGAYFALRNAIEVEERRAALAAVYSIFAFLTVPFLVFVVPRIAPSLHPGDSIVDGGFKLQMNPTVGVVFILSMVSFTVLYLWMFQLRMRVRYLARAKREEEI